MDIKTPRQLESKVTLHKDSTIIPGFSPPVLAEIEGTESVIHVIYRCSIWQEQAVIRFETEIMFFYFLDFLDLKKCKKYFISEKIEGADVKNWIG